MRIGVIGAGAVGGAMAALIARGGHDVEVTARGAHLEAIRQGGIQLAGAWGIATAAVTASTRLTPGNELTIIATKAQDAHAAITENLSAVTGAPLLVVQNGLDGMSIARAASPHSDVVGGLAVFASSYLSPGTITVTTRGPTYIGTDDGTNAARALRRFQDVLDRVMPTTVVDNFVGAQWTKLVVNQLNALPAITGLSVQQVIANARLRTILTASMAESVRIGVAGGIRFETLQGLSHLRLTTFARLPGWVGQALPLQMARRMGTTPNPGSTLQSIRRGTVTEIDYLNGAVVRAAEAAGVSAPINSALVSLVHRVESSGEFVEVSEVVTALRAAFGSSARR